MLELASRRFSGRRPYSSASEYVRELVRADQKRKAKEELETVLLEALKSEPETVTPEWWARLREEIRSEAKPRRVAGFVT
jgi:antitoxin ParD1/3/4